jgi:hypothetical protein
MQIVSILGPIVLVLAVGQVAMRSGFLRRATFDDINRLVYWIGLPALLFHKIQSARIEGDMAVRILSVLLVGTLGSALLGYAAGALLRLPLRSRVALVQTALRGNLAYVGLPVVLFALGESGVATPALEAAVVLSISPLIPIYNIVAVLIMSGCVDTAPEPGWRRALTLSGRVVRNPLVLACALGLFCSWMRWPLPSALDRTVAALGQMALPLSLLTIGSTLRIGRLKSNAPAAALSALIKVVAAPCIGALAARGLGLTAVETRVVLLFLACPTAFASYVIAQQLGADDALTADAIVLSTLLSIPVFSLILALT